VIIRVQNDVMLLHQLNMIHVVFLLIKKLHNAVITYVFNVHEHRPLVIANTQY
jgi:hypothetical protein